MEYEKLDDALNVENIKKIFAVSLEEFDRKTNEYSGRFGQWFFDNEEEAYAMYNAIDVQYEFRRMSAADRRNSIVGKDIGCWEVEDDDVTDFDCYDSEYAGGTRKVTYTVDGKTDTCEIEYGKDITDFFSYEKGIDLEQAGYCEYEYEDDDGKHTVKVDDAPEYWG